MSNRYSDLQQIVLDDIPLVDVRAPVEFFGGSFPGAVNLPLMDDEERRKVGICYKERGKDAAIKLGYRLVSGEKKRKRVLAWTEFIRSHPEALLFCFRGGMRSQIAQQWIEEEIGKVVPRISGGSKAFRSYLLGWLEPDKIRSRPIILGGRTGSGKTQLINQLKNGIDLEGIANHRGSAFGNYLTPQPGQKDFENQLAWALIKHDHQAHKTMVLEDEGSYIGSCSLPRELVIHFNRNDNLVLLQAPIEARIDNILQEYVIDAQSSHRVLHGDEKGLGKWFEKLNTSVDRIRKRLGGEKKQRVQQLIQDAYLQQREGNGYDGHRLWIGVLLKEYYDPMYDYQLDKKKQSILFTGNSDEVMEFFHLQERD